MTQRLTQSASQVKTGRISRWYQGWLRRRIPPMRQLTLNQRRIFIFPSGYGFFYIALCILLFLGGINYENNLIIGLSFLLASLFVNSILYTYRNLSGLTLAAGSFRPGFAGANGALEIKLKAAGHAHRSLWLRWPGGPFREVSVEKQTETILWLDLPLPHRGKVAPGRLRIQTRYPLGLLRAWSLLDLDSYCLAWPRAIATLEEPTSGGNVDASERQRQTGNDDFDGLRKYSEGDSLRLVDWKSYARGRGLHTKQFSDPVEGRLWLEWQRLAGTDVERRLSYLCYWVQQLDQAGISYGVSLPTFKLPPSRGSQHRRAALDLLALYGESP